MVPVACNMLSYHFSKNLTKPIRQHFPGDIPGKLPKPPQSWPHAYGAQVVLYVIYRQQTFSRDTEGWPTHWKNLRPALFTSLWETTTPKQIWSSRTRTPLGRWGTTWHLFPPKEIQPEHWILLDNIVLLFWRTTCTVEPMCTTVWSLPIAEPTKSPTTDRSKPELPGRWTSCLGQSTRW